MRRGDNDCGQYYAITAFYDGKAHALINPYVDKVQVGLDAVEYTYEEKGKLSFCTTAFLTCQTEPLFITNPDLSDGNVTEIPRNYTARAIRTPETF